MKIIFSPSKTQKLEKYVEVTPVLFKSESGVLLSGLKKLSIKELQDIFKISENIALGLFAAYQEKMKEKGDGELDFGNALASYSGTSFSQLKVSEYSKNEWRFAQKHVCILSGLYGLLRPQDAIERHRLDVAQNISFIKNLKNKESKNLYEYWKNSVNEVLDSEKIILNLASKEYSKMLTHNNLEKCITTHFIVKISGAGKGNGSLKYKTVSVYSKQQRGKMLDFVIQNELTNLSQLKKYTSDGFIFEPSLSSKKEFFYVKEG